jgi:hypothetical protein
LFSKVQGQEGILQFCLVHSISIVLDDLKAHRDFSDFSCISGGTNQMRKNNRYKHRSSGASDAPLLNDESSITSAGHGASDVPPPGILIPAVANASSQQPFLYDPMAMLELSPALCQGYISLLSAGKAGEQPRKIGVNESTYSHIELAYAAIVDGNVVDACFGVRVSSKKNTSTEKRIKEVKEMIDILVNNSTDDDENLEEIAVLAYLTAFQSIVQMHSKLKQMNMILKCFCTKRIRNHTLQTLKKCFHPLQQKIRNLQSTPRH